jgi:hypothetical protein
MLGRGLRADTEILREFELVTAKSEVDAQRLKLAWEEFGRTGVAAVRCDQCGQPIIFETITDTAWRHQCLCGKFSGTLRGL